MKPEHQVEPQQHLKIVERWRSTRGSISLCNVAVDLTASHFTFRIARTLRLDYNKLKHRIQERSSQRPPYEFVEVKVQLLAGCIVEFRSPSGFEFKIQVDATFQSQLPVLVSFFVSQSA